MKAPFSKVVEGLSPSGIRTFFDLVIGKEDILSLGVGEPDFNTPLKIREEAIQKIEMGLTSYTSNKGLLSLREKISEYLKRRFECRYNPETDLLITNGVSEAVDIVLRILLDPGDEVIVPEPNYVCYTSLVMMTGGRSVSIDTSQTHFIPDPRQIEAKITAKTKAIILCSPNNPTGQVIPKNILQEIAKIAQKHDIWVIADEIYAELLYSDDPYTSFASLDGMHSHTILLNGFSKAYAMTGWRLGYIAAPESVIERCLKIHQYSALCAPIISQYAAQRALEPDIDQEVRAMRDQYNMRRQFCVTRFKEMGLDLEIPQGAFYCFPSIQSTGLSSQDFALKLLDKHQVAVVPGHVFGQGGEGYIRCCYATSIDTLEKSLDQIEKFIKNI